MKIAVMQPYLFPYLGYHQLISAADLFAIYDDVQFTKSGWINRNRILRDGQPMWFTLPVVRASRKGTIDGCCFADAKGQNRRRLLKTLKQNYNCAPFFDGVYNLVENVFSTDNLNVARFLTRALLQTCQYMELRTPFVLASSLQLGDALRGQDRVLELCRRVGADEYLNPVGGMDLYERERFAEAGVTIRFLRMEPIRYRQFGQRFVPDLSIVDVLMFNGPTAVTRLLKRYRLC